MTRSLLCGLLLAIVPTISVAQPASGTIAVDTGDTAIDSVYRSVRHTLRPAWGDASSQRRASKAHGVLMVLTRSGFNAVVRRLCHRSAKHMGRYVQHVTRDELTFFCYLVARKADPFTARSLIERLSEAEVKRLLEASRRLEPAIRAELEAKIGDPAQVQTAIRARREAQVAGQLLGQSRKLQGNALSAWVGRRLARTRARELKALRERNEPVYAETLTRMATDRAGEPINDYVHQLTPSGRADLLRWLAASDAGVRLAPLMRDSLHADELRALLHAAERLDPATRAQVFDRLGGKAVVEARITHLESSARSGAALKDLVGEGAEVALGRLKPTAEDQAWLREVRGEIKRQGEGRLRALLEQASPRRFWMLWEALPSITLPFPPSRYLGVLRTRKGEAWRVLWHFSRDVDAEVVDQVSAQLPIPALRELRPTLQYIRKEFWVARKGRLEGGTTFGYHPGRFGSGEFTPNVIRMGTFRGRQVAVMLYRERPWYDPITRTGFADLFVPISKNIIISPGLYGRYGGRELKGLSPWQFYMVRMPVDGEVPPLRAKRGLAGSLPGS